ncbi:hypothetical protein QZN11_34400 [Streptomyces gramineus]|uniref:hypothetical protein n=1 Tax=Streptomyces gramineus TaxID=910542 RepID=UPI00398A8FF0
MTAVNLRDLTRRTAFSGLPLVMLTAGLAGAGLSGAPVAAAAGAATAAATTPDPIDPDSLFLNGWMGQIRDVIGDRPLNKVVMPGSHDAGSWSITDKSGVCDTASEASNTHKYPAVAAAISVTQSGPIKAQLDAGSRYLDLRLCKQNGKWYTYHGGPLGGLFFDDPASGQKGEINDIAAWIRDHPKEIVTIDLRTSVPTESATADNKEAVDLLARAIGTGRMADKNKLRPSSTYNQYMAAGSNVILLDNTSSTDAGWDWPKDRIDGRDSYVENKDWGGLIKEAVTNPFSSDPAIDKISRTALDRDQQVLSTNLGKPDTFFSLSGNVDSTLAIPDAAYDVASNGMNFRGGDGVPYMLYLARQHNYNLVKKLEGEWRYSSIARNTNIVAYDNVNMGDGRGPIRGSGYINAAIIANNTPTTAPGTLVGTQRRPDGSWSAAETLPGAYGALEFAGGERAVTAMPNGDLQFLVYGTDKHLYHSIRSANGSWSGWNRLDSDAVDSQLNGGPLAMTGTPDGSLQALTVDRDGNLLHTLRRPDGSWSGWAGVGDGTGKGVMKAKDVAVTSLPNNSVKVLVYGQDGAMRLTERYADGTWEKSGWQVLPGAGGAATFAGKDLSITATRDSTLQIAAIGQDGNVWHMAQSPQRVNSGWNTPLWSAGQPMQASAVAIAATPDGAAQLLAVGKDGNTWHSLRQADGRWTGFAAPHGAYNRLLAATSVKITGLPDGSTYSLIDAR